MRDGNGDLDDEEEDGHRTPFPTEGERVETKIGRDRFKFLVQHGVIFNGLLYVIGLEEIVDVIVELIRHALAFVDLDRRQ